MPERADLILLTRGLAASRTTAQHLIEAGRVFVVNGNQRTAVTKPGQKLTSLVELEVQADPADRFVSRGGLKMLGALQHTRLTVTGHRVLDIGISTGGFTDCLLQAGAEHVIGVDVGHRQLAARLATDPRVTLQEGVNARYLQPADLAPYLAGALIDLIVVDVSFISLALILPMAAPLLRPHGTLLSLVKPQFEVGREGLSKNGLVKDERLYPQVERKIRDLCPALGLTVHDYFDSPIKGGDGNREFFVLASRTA